MMIPELSVGTNPHFQVAIHGLPIELRSLQPASLYWVNVEGQSLFIPLLRQILNSSGDGARGVLASSDDPTHLFETLALTPAQRDIRLFQLGGKLKPDIDHLTRSLDRHLRPKERTILLCLQADQINADHRDFAELLHRWKRWLLANDCTLLVLACCNNAEYLTRKLAPFNEALSGLSSLAPNDSDSYHYRIEYWRSPLGAMSAQAITVKPHNNGLHVVGSAHATTAYRNRQAHTKFLFERAALKGFSVQFNNDWQVFESRQALVDQATTETNATVVFSLPSPEQLPELAAVVHRLRQERGPLLKLVLYEVGTPLRHLDEQRILDCGATLVVPAGTPITRFLSMLEEIQPLVYARELVSDPALLFGLELNEKTTGIVAAPEFIDYLHQLLKSTSSDIPGILVCMRPAPGLNANITLQELNLKRFDDVACALGEHLYIFLYGCHPHLVSVALTTLFRISYEELFISHTELGSREEIEAQYQRMRFELDEIQSSLASGVTTAPLLKEQLSTSPHDGSLAPIAGQAPTRQRHYHPERLTLAIKHA